MDTETLALIERAQRNEMTEQQIYQRLAARVKNAEHRKLLQKIAADEGRHAAFWKGFTKRDILPDKAKIAWYVFVSQTFGLTFGIKLMENGENLAQKAYARIAKKIPAVRRIQADEEKHEKALVRLIEDESLHYAGSIVLGLNDALVELTGALAGFTLAFQKTGLVAVAGLITGIAAALSMATSEYLSTKAEPGRKDPVKASVYTGIAYLLTVLLLITPYLLFKNVFMALGCTLMVALLIILVFNFYISVAQELSFKKRFLEMACLSLGVAGISFLIGLAVRTFLHLEV
ncbi:MAG: VIT1/CCC1 transporter family protein [Nanoarchaeota archaeon]